MVLGESPENLIKNYFFNPLNFNIFNELIGEAIPAEVRSQN